MVTGENMVRIGTWNTKWARPGSVKGERVGALLAEPRILRESCHPFYAKVATCSNRKLPPVLKQSCHLF